MEPERARRRRSGSAPERSAHARRWLRALAGICLAAAAVAVFRPDAGARAQAAPVQDTMTVNPSAVPASSTHDFSFSYIPKDPAGKPLVITLDIPPGWTRPVMASPAQPTAAGWVSVDCPGCQVIRTAVAPVFHLDVTGRKITISRFRLIPDGNPPYSMRLLLPRLPPSAPHPKSR